MTSDVSHIIKDEKKITAKTCPIADHNIESATEKATVRIDATITKKTGDEKETFQTLTRSSGRVAKRVKRDISPPASPPKKSGWHYHRIYSCSGLPVYHISPIMHGHLPFKVVNRPCQGTECSASMLSIGHI